MISFYWVLRNEHVGWHGYCKMCLWSGVPQISSQLDCQNALASNPVISFSKK